VTAQLEYGRTIVFFRWSGFDEGDEICGDGSADLQDDGTTGIELAFDNGDDTVRPHVATDFFKPGNTPSRLLKKSVVLAPWA
jgi:hypothetical protein